MADYRLLGLSLCSFFLSISVIFIADWLEQTDQTAIVAHNRYLNLYVHFYAEPLRTNVGLIAPEALFSCLISCSTLVLNEGHRRRQTFPTALLSIYVGLSLLVGAGTVTPLFLAFFHEKDAQAPVGAMAAVVHLLAVVSSGIVFGGVVRNRLKVFSVVIISFWPAATSFMSVAVEKVMGLRRPASRLLLEAPFVVAILVGALAHYHALTHVVFASVGYERFIVELEGDAAFRFMLLNVAMLALSTNLWLLFHGGKRISLHLKLLPLLFVVGPAAHLGLHGLLHERRLRALKSHKE